MCQRVTLAIVVVVLLTGTPILLAREQGVDRPRGDEVRDRDRPAERQAMMRDRGERAERIQPERGVRERAGRGDRPAAEAPPRMGGARRPALPGASARIGSAQQGSGNWLDALTAAYRQNDREKMGQLIRRLRQIRPQGQLRGQAWSPRWQQGRGRPGAGYMWRNRFRGGPPRWGQCYGRGWCPRWGAMAGQNRTFQPRGFGWWRQDRSQPTLRDRPGTPAPLQDVPAPMSPERPRGFGWRRPEGPPPALRDRPTAPTPPQDVVRPMPPEPRGGRARRGWTPPSLPGPGGPRPEQKMD